ncbi:MAG: NfeD family protein [Bacilli bacterium]
MDTYTLLWIGVIIGFIILEVLTPNMITIGFSIAAIIPLILQLLGVAFIYQLIAYLISLMVIGYYLIPILKRVSKIGVIKFSPDGKTNLDLIIGATGHCLEPIALYKNGVVRVENKDWSAAVENDETIAIHDLIEVKRIEGAKLIVTAFKPKEEL